MENVERHRNPRLHIYIKQVAGCCQCIGCSYMHNQNNDESRCCCALISFSLNQLFSAFLSPFTNNNVHSCCTHRMEDILIWTINLKSIHRQTTCCCQKEGMWNRKKCKDIYPPLPPNNTASEDRIRIMAGVVVADYIYTAAVVFTG